MVEARRISLVIMEVRGRIGKEMERKGGKIIQQIHAPFDRSWA